MIAYRDGDPWLTCDGCFKPTDRLTWEQVERMPVEQQGHTCSDACALRFEERRARPAKHRHPDDVPTADCPACFIQAH